MTTLFERNEDCVTGFLKRTDFNLPGQFSHSGQLFLHWAAANLKRHIGFQNKKKNSRSAFLKTNSVFQPKAVF